MYTIRKLRQMGKEKGIKWFSKMNSQTLCEKLNIPYERNQSFDLHNKEKINNPVSILCVHPVTGEQVAEFQSIYKTAKYLNVNPGYIYKYIKSEKVVVVFGKELKLIKKP